MLWILQQDYIKPYNYSRRERIHTMDDRISFVRDNYKEVAKLYYDQKDPRQSEFAIFRKWQKQVDLVLELGCASGYPIAKAILGEGKQYTGIDLSPEQIKLAKNKYPQWADHFHEAEMLQFVKSQPSNSYSGVISFFSIRHLPRIHHVELFDNIKRVLKPGGLFLVDHPQYRDDGKGTWFGDHPMYWSSFTSEWQMMTLKELGFELIEEYDDVAIFDGEEEYTKYCMYQVSKKSGS